MVDVFEGDGKEGSFLVLVNGLGQYCIWPALRDVPAGWTATGDRGARDRCLAWVEAHWADIRPHPVADAGSSS